jgi:hypothetical protein
MGAPIHQIVDLHKVNASGAQAPKGLFHLTNACLSPVGPHLGGKEKLVTHTKLGGEATDDTL